MTPQDSQSASKLLAGSQVFAVNSRDGFAAEYPTLGQLSSDEWNGRIAIAGTGTALLMIPARYSRDHQKELTAAVVTTIQEWDHEAVQSLAEFINFVTAGALNPDDVPDVIGGWVIRNLPMAPPEQSAAHVIGLMLMNTFAPWWDQQR
jgi:hypothetical protein